jgi:hypothetical protein
MKGIMVIVSHKEARSRPWQSRVLVAGGEPVAKWRDAARADGRNDAISASGDREIVHFWRF